MSFLDNLENNLKALEAQEQGGVDDVRRRDQERSRALAAAPWAERLKKASYTQSLMALATRAGFARRTKVHLVWLETTLRLEAGDLRLELRPVPDGVRAVFLDGASETGEELLDLSGNPQVLVTAWMQMIDAKRKLEAETRVEEEPEE